MHLEEFQREIGRLVMNTVGAALTLRHGSIRGHLSYWSDSIEDTSEYGPENLVYDLMIWTATGDQVARGRLKWWYSASQFDQVQAEQSARMVPREGRDE